MKASETAKKKTSTKNAKAKKPGKASAGAGTKDGELFPDETVALPATPAAEIPRTYHDKFNLSLIAEARDNARKARDEKKRAEIKGSIAEKGVQNPLWIRALASSGKNGETHEVFAGSTRRELACELGLLTVPVFDYGAIDDQTADELADLENAQRKDLNEAEKALSYAKMVDKYGWDVFNEKEPQRSLAHRLSLGSKSEAHQWMRLARMPKACLEALALGSNGGITRSVAAQICRIGDPKRQNEALLHAVRDRWTDKMAGAEIERNFLVELKGVPFDRSDPTLVLTAGSCDACPFRSGNQLELSPELRRRGDICTKPECLRGKLRANFERRAKDHAAKGGKVWSDKEAGENGLGTSWSSLDNAYIEIDEPQQRLDWNSNLPGDKPVRKLIEPFLEDGSVKIILAFSRDGKGQIWEIVEREPVLKLLQQNGLIKKRASGSGSDSWAKQQAETRKKRERAQKLLGLQIGVIVGKAEKLGGGMKLPEPAVQALRITCQKMAWMAGAERTRWASKRRGLAEAHFELKNEKLDHSKLVERAIQAAETPALLGWAAELCSWPPYLGYTDPEKLDSETKPVQEWLGVSADTLLKNAREELKAAEAAKAKGKGKKAPADPQALLTKLAERRQAVAEEPDKRDVEKAAALLKKMKERKRPQDFTADVVKKKLGVTKEMAAVIVAKVTGGSKK